MTSTTTMKIIQVEDGDGKPFCFGEWKSRPVLPFPDVDKRLQTFYTQFHPRANDILLQAFPKSGTHWLHHIVYKLIQQDANFIPPEKDLNFIENQNLHELNQLSSPRMLNTHLYLEQLPVEALKCPKIIYILRNPKDVAVSAFHHHQNMPELGRGDLTWKGFFKIINKNGVEDVMMNWFNHTRQWWKYLHEQCSPESFLILHYEELLEFPNENIEKIANFLQISCSQQLAKEIVEATKIGKLREVNVLRAKDSSSAERQLKFYRKGIVGDWKNYFTVAQNEAYNQLYFEEEKMNELGLNVEKYMS